MILGFSQKCPNSVSGNIRKERSTKEVFWLYNSQVSATELDMHDREEGGLKSSRLEC